MPTLELSAPDALPLLRADAEPERATRSQLVVIADGTDASTAALQSADALARRDRLELNVVGVAPRTARAAGRAAPAPRRDGEARIRNQVRLVLGGAEDWELRFEDGRSAEAVDRIARESRAGMIVLEIGAPGSAEREQAVQTALQLVRLADVPVLAVVPGAEPLPRHALVAVSFDRSATRALHVTLGLLDSPGAVTLAHIYSRRPFHSEPPRGWRIRHAREVAARFRRLESGLDLPRGIRLEKTMKEGDPAALVPALARERGADLIAAVMPGSSLLERILLGKTAARMLATADRPVLITPAWNGAADSARSGARA